MGSDGTAAAAEADLNPTQRTIIEGARWLAELELTLAAVTSDDANIPEESTAVEPSPSDDSPMQQQHAACGTMISLLPRTFSH